MIARRHVSGILWPHDRLVIRLRGMRARYTVLMIVGCVPWFLGSAATNVSAPCGARDGYPPHHAWFGCVMQQLRQHHNDSMGSLLVVNSMWEEYTEAELEGNRQHLDGLERAALKLTSS